MVKDNSHVKRPMEEQSKKGFTKQIEAENVLKSVVEAFKICV
jgi:hypothetical protein